MHTFLIVTATCLNSYCYSIWLILNNEEKTKKSNQEKAFCNNHLIQGYIVVFWYLDICIICKLRTKSDHSMTQNDKTFTENNKVILKKNRKST